MVLGRTAHRLRWVAIAALAWGAAACAEAVTPPQAKVWSTAHSNDGFASCPDGTTVTGGGFEMKEKAVSPASVPVVIANRPEANGWRVICVDASGSNACRAWAVCASVLAR